MMDGSRLESMVETMQSTMATLQTTLLMMENAVTNNTNAQHELSQSVKDLRGEMAQFYVRKDVLDPTLEAIKTNVKEHDDWLTWANRIVLALVIAAVIGGVIYTGK